MSFTTIPETFLLTADSCGDKPAFHFFDREWKTLTYRGLSQKVKGIAAALLEKGVVKGDRVAIFSENRPEWCAAYLGVSLAGGIVVPIDVQLGPQELRNLLADCGAKAVFHTAGTGETMRKSMHLLGPDQDADPQLSSQRWKGSPAMRSYASTYLARVFSTTSGGSSGPGGEWSQPDWSSQSRTYCLS